jgi:hypothetical protein
MEDSNNPYKKVAITTGHLLPLILASIIIISLLRCDDGPFGAALVLGLFWWLILPVTIWALVVFVRSVKMRTKLEKIVFAWGCVLLVLTGIFIFSPFNKEKPCNPDIMAEYCNEHEQEMRELIAYANQSLEPGKRMELEFEKGKVSRFHIFANDKDSIWSTHWDPANTDSLMQIVGLDEGEFDNIRQRLKDMECISIEAHTTHEDYATIGFRRVGFGMYSFVIYNRPMTPKEIKKYTEDLMFIPYNDHVVFQFGGGVFGIQTFVPDMKEDFMKRHPVE